jgi:hypothetical protein
VRSATLHTGNGPRQTFAVLLRRFSRRLFSRAARSVRHFNLDSRIDEVMQPPVPVLLQAAAK